MFDAPIGDFIAKFGHLIGWTVLVGIAWRLRGVVEEQVNLWRGIDKQTKEAVHEVVIVKEKVDTMQTNHMAHMQRDLENISKSNDAAVEALQDIGKGIAVLVDRGTRETIIETKIKHIEPGKPGDNGTKE